MKRIALGLVREPVKELRLGGEEGRRVRRGVEAAAVGKALKGSVVHCCVAEMAAGEGAGAGRRAAAAGEEATPQLIRAESEADGAAVRGRGAAVPGGAEAQALRQKAAAAAAEAGAAKAAAAGEKRRGTEWQAPRHRHLGPQR